MASEQVRFDILIEAKIAMATMKELLKDTQDNNIKMRNSQKRTNPLCLEMWVDKICLLVRGKFFRVWRMVEE